MENIEKKQKPTIVTKIFYNKDIFHKILEFLNEKSKDVLKNCFKKTGFKEKKKQIKEFVKKYIVDFGKHQEKLKYRFSDEGNLIINTSIFNLNNNYLKEFVSVFHRETKDQLELEKEDLYGYLKVLPKFDFCLSNNKGDFLKSCKALVPFDCSIEDADPNADSDDNPNKKYEMFYNMSEIESKLPPIDFSNKEALIERQKRILELMNAEKNKVFYPLEFICSVNYWCIILCHGGYFACGFFNKDKIIEHKSDHKYVTRKKAGQRQITKDKSKQVKSSVGAQMRRENEKKHQENIEFILKVNEEFLLKSDAIFLQAPGLNKNILVGDNRPLVSFRKKIINIPFNVLKANYTNMMEIYTKLTSVTLEVSSEEVRKLVK